MNLTSVRMTMKGRDFKRAGRTPSGYGSRKETLKKRLSGLYSAVNEEVLMRVSRAQARESFPKTYRAMTDAEKVLGLNNLN